MGGFQETSSLMAAEYVILETLEILRADHG